ncbi:MAG: DUF262 domain-containing protein [Akkermansiaceae bacterium]
MPAYSAKTIKDVMINIGQDKIFLPALQRKFVWNADQIEKLFDSIMRGYPIGTFLFWEVDDGTENNYVFYKFLQNFSGYDNWKNEIAPQPILEGNITGVLDGQQRLNSMYVALQGSYAYHTKGRRRNRRESYPKRLFYVNVFFEAAEYDQVEYQFAFKTEGDVSPQRFNEPECWFPVKEVLTAGESDHVEDLWENFLKNIPQNFEITHDQNRKAKRLLNRLYNRLTTEELINYFPVKNQSLDEILDIFVRVNSGGKVLSKTDLLFSTIVAHWDDGREKIENFLADINSLGDGFNFGTDWIMRSCLILCDFGSKLNVSAFGAANVETIKSNWQKITESITDTVVLLVDWGFDASKLTSANAVILIVYAHHLGFDINRSKESLRLYLIRALMTGLFGSHSDQTLIDIRSYLKKSLPESNEFTVTDFAKHCKLPSGRSISLNEDDLDNFLDHETSGGGTFLVLSLLYSGCRFSQMHFHQDHIHPKKAFYKSNLNTLGLDGDAQQTWIAKRDTLPNLQLLEKSANQSKSGKKFTEWVADKYVTQETKDAYLTANHIGLNTSLEFGDFETFWSERRKTLKTNLAEILEINLL